MGFLVTGVEPGSIAEEIGIQPGDTITAMGGEPLLDYIDYLFFSAKEELTLTVETAGGETFEAEIEKDAEEMLGISFAGDGFGKKRSCHNKCIFCFVDQLPKGMRKTLYFKDDDWRMSFVMGNYITLTNVNEAEFERILRRKTSPLYISVHATDDDVRAYMLSQPKGRGIMERLRRLKDAGIHFECQAVLVGGVNDGPVLEKTIRDLETLYPYAESLALVPLGLTGHREGLKQLAPIDKKCAEGILDIAEKWQGHFLKKYGTRFVFGADELYIKAGRPIPAYETYEDFKQMEDGVGLLRYLTDETRRALAAFEGVSRHREISIATGVDAAPYIAALAGECGKKLDVRVHVYPIRNEFFGETITVTGLLTGGDIISQLRGKALGEKLYVSSCMLRDRENVFLDDLTKEEVSRALGVPLGTIDNEGEDFVRALAGCGED